MGTSLLVFKAIAVLHALAGYFFFGIATADGAQEVWAYKNRNSLAGDVLKYLAYFACFSLIGCGIAAFFIPWAAVVLAWLSVGFYLSTAVVDVVAKRRWPHFCKASAISVGVRTFAAGALTALLYG